MRSIKQPFRGAAGWLSLFIWLLCFSGAQAQSTSHAETQAHFQALLAQGTQGLPVPAAGLILLEPGQPPLQLHHGALQADSLLPLHRLTELLVSLALLDLQAQQDLQLSDPVNFHLQGFRLQSPHGDVTLRDLLLRQGGFALRESGLFVTDPKRAPGLKELLTQELKPLPWPVGEVLSVHSAGDLLLAQVLENLSAQRLERYLPAYAQSRWGLSLSPAAATPPFVSYDPEGRAMAYLPPATPTLHAYAAPLPQVTVWLQALLQAAQRPEFEGLFRAQGIKPPQLTGSSLGLLVTRLQGQEIFYLDSEWLGFSQRLAIFPAQQRAFYLISNQAQPLLKEQVSLAVAQLAGNLAREGSQLLSESDCVSAPAGHYYPLAQEPETLLKALRPFTQLRMDASGEWSGPGVAGALPAALTQACELAFEPSRQRLFSRQALAGHHVFQRSQGFELPWLQWLLLGLFALGFVSMLVRSLHFLYLYQPELKLSEPDTEAENTETALPAPATRASWDLPLLGSLGSLLAVSFTLGIYPILLHLGRLGPHLSLAVRNQPSGALVLWLLMPLLIWVLTLILLALLVAEWRTRPWGRQERLHYCLYAASIVLWTLWLGHHHLLGFRF